MATSIACVIFLKLKQPEVDSGRAEETDAACNAIIVTLETQKGNVNSYKNNMSIFILFELVLL